MASFKPLVIVIFILFSTAVSAQELKPGFDKAEYIETLKINHKVHIPLDKWNENKTVPDPQYFTFAYRSPVVAFDNIWDLWIHNKKPVALVSVQGSIPTDASFLANLYAAMIPATGELQLDQDLLFEYKLADHPNAAVHVGWLVAMAYLSETVESKTDSLYQKGIKDFILTGHSQGGGIIYMLTAYLHPIAIGRQTAARHPIQNLLQCRA